MGREPWESTGLSSASEAWNALFEGHTWALAKIRTLQKENERLTAERQTPKSPTSFRVSRALKPEPAHAPPPPLAPTVSTEEHARVLKENKELTKFAKKTMGMNQTNLATLKTRIPEKLDLAAEKTALQQKLAGLKAKNVVQQKLAAEKYAARLETIRKRVSEQEEPDHRLETDVHNMMIESRGIP